MNDLSSLKIPIHPGINDQPKEPTPEQKQNISYVNSQINSLIDALQPILSDHDSRIGQLETSSGDSGGDTSGGTGTTQTISVTLIDSSNFQPIGTSQGGTLVAYTFDDPNLLGFLTLADDEEGLLFEGTVSAPSDNPQRFILDTPITISEFFDLALVYENLVAGTQVDLILFFE